jgi:hypothetical protein
MFLRMFSGEVLTTFEENNIMMPLNVTRTIPHGKSAQFPTSGVASALYHTPGTNIADSDNSLLSEPLGGERHIFIDGMLTSSVFLANIDEAMNHYDIRSIYSREVGMALANTADKAMLRTVIAAARTKLTHSSASRTRANSMVGSAAGVETSASTLIDAIFEGAQKLDEQDVPSSDRYCVIPPSMYYLLVNGTNAINRDFGGSGSIERGEQALEIAGITVLKSNHLPAQANEGTGGTPVAPFNDNSIQNNVFSGTCDNVISGMATPTSDGYSGGDFLKTAGVIFHKAAIGTVKLLDLAVESEYQISRQGTLIVCKYAMGHNVLRPECALEIVTA